MNRGSVVGGLTVRPMTRADWSWIAAWFDEAELKLRLGPVDEQWAEHVVASIQGVQLVVNATDDVTPVALVGCAWDPGGVAHGITDIAVCPWMRRSGLGGRALVSAMTWGGHPPAEGWIAFVDPDNHPARDFFAAHGWGDGGLDEGMQRFELRHVQVEE